MPQQNKYDFNGFDEIRGIDNPEELAHLEAQKKEMWNKLDQLIHRVFEQNPAGKELLEIWKEALIMQPTVTPNSTQFQAGIAEGNKEFIRNIYLTIASVESNK